MLLRGVGVVVDRDLLVAHGAPEGLLFGEDVGVHGDLLDGHDFGGDVGPFGVEHDDHVLPDAEFVGDVVAGVLGGGEGLVFEAELLAAQMHDNRLSSVMMCLLTRTVPTGTDSVATCSCSSERVTTSGSGCSAGEGLVGGVVVGSSKGP